MSQQHKVLDAREFADLFAKPGGLGTSGDITVHGDVLLNGKLMGLSEGAPVSPSRSNSCQLRNVAFTGNITICNFDQVSWSFQNCNFIQTLRVEGCSGIHWNLMDCDATLIRLHQCEFESARIRKLTCQALDLAGFSLSKGFVLMESEIDTVEIWTASIRKLLTVPIVETDDPVFARKLELVRIPVVVPESIARAMVPEALRGPRIDKTVY